MAAARVTSPRTVVGRGAWTNLGPCKASCEVHEANHGQAPPAFLRLGGYVPASISARRASPAALNRACLTSPFTVL